MILQTMPPFDAAHVIPHLWVGGHTAARSVHEFTEPRFTLLALCAKEIQIKTPFHGVILRPAFDDANPIPAEAVVRAIEAGQETAKHVKKGGRALVTCAAGLNRSALVAGIAIKELYPRWSADRIIMQIRKMRSEDALCNPYFCSLLQMYCNDNE